MANALVSTTQTEFGSGKLTHQRVGDLILGATQGDRNPSSLTVFHTLSAESILQWAQLRKRNNPALLGWLFLPVDISSFTPAMGNK